MTDRIRWRWSNGDTGRVAPLPSIAPGTPVLVRWEDAHFSTSPDSEVRTVEFVSIGFLVEETAERIAIAQSKRDTGHAEILTIPTGIVRQVTVIGARNRSAT